MSRLTDEELAKAREVCEKATPGPWYAEANSRGWTLNQKGANEDEDCWIADFGVVNAEEDIGFIALARSLLPRLLDEVTELREERAAIEYAAHMPADYEYGLPSWINQRLYVRLLQFTDKDGGPLRRFEDVEELRRLRQENRRLAVYAAAYDDMSIEFDDAAKALGMTWDEFQQMGEEIRQRGRALIAGKEASGE